MDGEKSKEDTSPSEECSKSDDPKVEDVMTASLISDVTTQFISNEQIAHRMETSESLEPDVVRNGTHSNGINDNKPANDKELNGLNHANIQADINSQTIPLDNVVM